jgi:hypothetical protein
MPRNEPLIQLMHSRLTCLLGNSILARHSESPLFRPGAETEAYMVPTRRAVEDEQT